MAIHLPSTAQGFNSSPEERKVIEDYAVALATKYLQEQHYSVEPYGKPFDLLCRKEAETLYVEVKGTQGSGEEILLTKGEVDLNRNSSNKMALFIVSEINISVDNLASGGKSTVRMPWIINEDSLSPYAFSYRV